MEDKIQKLTNAVPGVVNHVMLLPRMGRLLIGLFRDPRVPRFLKILTAGLAVYIALPYDFLPDIVPGVGAADDLIALLLVLVQYVRWCPAEVVAEHWDDAFGGEFDSRADFERAVAELEPLVGARFDYLRTGLQNVLDKVGDFRARGDYCDPAAGIQPGMEED